MPGFMIENTSPLIVYEPVGSWREGNKVNDLEAGRYSGNSSFTLTTAPNASASFNFTGTSVLIAGAKRFNHGSYSVTLDGQTSSFDGFAEGVGLFQVPLFQADNLEPGEHSVIVRNLPTGTQEFLDIDFIQWTSPGKDGSDTDSSNVNTIQDTQFVYEPPEAWLADISQLPGFSNSSGHSSTQVGAKVTINFEGTGISVFSAVGPNQSPYSASLDGGPSMSFNAAKSEYAPQQMIYHVDRLKSGKHAIVLSKQPGGQMFSVDYAEVYKTDFGLGSSNSMSGGAIAGAVTGALVAVVLIAAGIFFFVKRRRREQRRVAWRTGYPELGANTPAFNTFTLAPAPAPGGPNPPPYQPDQPQPRAMDRVSRWRDETRQATLDDGAPESIDRPPSIHTITQVDAGETMTFRRSMNSEMTSSGWGGNTRSPHPYAFVSRDNVASSQDTHNPPPPEPIPPPLRSTFAPPPMQQYSSSAQPSSSTSPFWHLVKNGLRHSGGTTRGDDRHPPDLPAEPRFGQDVGNGKKFVNLA